MRFSKMLTASALGAISLFALSSVQAQTYLTPPGTLLPTAGTKEIGISGNYSFNGDKPYALQGSYGYFTTPTIEFGGVVSVSGSSGSKTASSLGAFGNYYFVSGEDNPLLPYIGVFAGYSRVKEDSASLGAQGGVKYFLNPNVALNAEFDYRAARHSGGQSNLVLGLSTFFR